METEVPQSFSNYRLEISASGSTRHRLLLPVSFSPDPFPKDGCLSNQSVFSADPLCKGVGRLPSLYEGKGRGDSTTAFHNPNLFYRQPGIYPTRIWHLSRRSMSGCTSFLYMVNCRPCVLVSHRYREAPRMI